MVLRIAWGLVSTYSQINSHVAQLAQEAGINIIHSYGWADWTTAYKGRIFAACDKYNVKLLLFEQWPGYWDGDEYIYDWDTTKKAKFDAIKNVPCIWGAQIEEPGDDAHNLPVWALTNVYDELKDLNSNWQIFCAFGWTSWPRDGHDVDGYFDSFGIDLYECHYEDVKQRLRDAMGSASNPDSMLHSSLYLMNTLGKTFIPVIQASNYKHLPDSGGVCPDCLKNQQEVYQELLPRSNDEDLAFYELLGFYPPNGGLSCIWNQVKALKPPTPNYAPTAPTSLLCEGTTNPTIVTDLTPELSAVYNDPNAGDIANAVEIHVATTEGGLGTPNKWDSGWISKSVNEGYRCSNISYAGSALALNGATYYWKVRFRDDENAVGAWSSVGTFKMASPPSAPTSLETEGATDPVGVTDLTPEFSAIFNDPEAGDKSKLVEIHVATTEDWINNPNMWDSGWISIAEVTQGNRCALISYAGSPLSLDETKYYWGMRFKDDGGSVGSWSWGLLDEDCFGIGDWVDDDKGVGVSEVSPVGQFRFDTNVSAAPNDYASRYRDITAPPTKHIVEIRLYLDDAAGPSSGDGFLLDYQRSDWTLRVFWGADGLWVVPASCIEQEVGDNIVTEGEWHTWRFEVDLSAGVANATVEIFLDDVSQGTVDCDFELAGTDGRVVLKQYGYGTDNQLSHVDYVKIRQSPLTGCFTMAASENNPPTAPTALLCEGEVNPVDVVDLTPEFSAEYNDPDAGDKANAVQIVVATTEDGLYSPDMWDSGWITLDPLLDEGARCSDVSYAGVVLSEDGTKYWWRIRFRDDDNAAGAWSAAAHFTMLPSANQAPTAPTSLECEAATDPTGVSDLTPEFTAIFEDPDAGDKANAIEIHVATTEEGLDTPDMWDSGWIGISGENLVEGNRCAEQSYAGDALSLDGTKYYWKVRFKDDDGAEGAWS